ncbi:MAG: hypothetical protein AB1423_14390 [Pseudomonadota bacterium]
MSDNGQIPMFYEDINDAISKMVNGNPNGLSIKQIAMTLWPSRNPDTARSVLSRAMNTENHDVQISPEELDKIMEITGAPEHILFYLCDKYGFERPPRKNKETFEKEMKKQVKGIQDQLGLLMRQLHQIEKMK